MPKAFTTQRPLGRQDRWSDSREGGVKRVGVKEREREKACGVRMRRQTGRAERERERGGVDWMNYDQKL